MLRLSIVRVTRLPCGTQASRCFSTSRRLLDDPRLKDIQRLGRVIEDEYAVLRDKYGMTTNQEVEYVMLTSP